MTTYIINPIFLIDQLYLKFSSLTAKQLCTSEALQVNSGILIFNAYGKFEASPKIRIEMDAEQTSSATVATAKSINKAIKTIDVTNNTNQTNYLQILNLEKESIQQNQTSNEILYHKKNLKGSQQGPLIFPTTPFIQKKNNTVDTTMTPSQSPEKEKQYYAQQTMRRNGMQWDNTQTRITEYNPISTPLQMFSHSTYYIPLNPILFNKKINNSWITN